MIVKGQGEAKAAMNGALDLNYNTHSITNNCDSPREKALNPRYIKFNHLALSEANSWVLQPGKQQLVKKSVCLLSDVGIFNEGG